MEALSLALAALAVLTAAYYYFFKPSNFFAENNIPYKPPTPLVGNMGPFVSKKLTMAETVKNIYNMNPEAKYVGFYDFTCPVIMLRDVDLVKSVAIKNFDSFTDHRPVFQKDLDPLLARTIFTLNGDKWRERRNQLTTMFTSSKIKSLFTLMSKVALNFTEHISQLPEEEKGVELKDIITKYTNDVIATCIFGVGVDSMKDPKNPMYVNGRVATNFSSTRVSLAFLMQRQFPLLARLFKIRIIPSRLTTFFVDLIRDNIKQREENNIQRPDMLQHLLEMQKNKANVTKDNIVITAFGFFLAGYDSVSSQACLVGYNLLAHPDCQARLQQEVDEALERTKGMITYDVISGMEYMDAVINETMRVYPAAVSLDRICTRDFELPAPAPGSKPILVKTGTCFAIPVHAIHTDPKYFDDPEEFRPERFLEDGKRIMSSGAYMPFGVGPRMCIGNRFALIEVKVWLFYLMAYCNLLPHPKMSIPFEAAKGTIVITAKDGFWMNVEPRKNRSPYLENLAEYVNKEMQSCF